LTARRRWLYETAHALGGGGGLPLTTGADAFAMAAHRSVALALASCCCYELEVYGRQQPKVLFCLGWARMRGAVAGALAGQEGAATAVFDEVLALLSVQGRAVDVQFRARVEKYRANIC
jgi:hypothetical protein